MAQPRKPKTGDFVDALGRHVQAEPVAATLDRPYRGANSKPRRVWEFGAEEMTLLREALFAEGWPKRVRHVSEALMRAVRSGRIDFSPVVRQYGASALASTPFIILPELEKKQYQRKYARFRVTMGAGGMTVYPPGWKDGTIVETVVQPERLPCLYFPLSPKHDYAHASAVNRLLTGGSKGGGKTDWVVAEAGRYCEESEYHGYAFRLTRDGFADLRRRMESMYEKMGAAKSGNAFTWDSGAYVSLHYLEKAKDAEVVQGHGPTRCFVDESPQNPYEEAIDTIDAEIRGGASHLHQCLFETGNPIGAGVVRVKRFYMETCGYDGGTYAEDVEIVDPDGKSLGVETLERRFIPMGVFDNPVLMSDLRYVARLQRLSKRMQQLLLYGDWRAARGAYYEELDEAKHLIPAHPVPEWARLRGGYDKGFAHRWWAVFYYRNVLGQLVVVDSLYGSRQYNDGIIDQWRAWERKGVDDGLPPHRKIGVVTASPGCFASKDAQHVGAVTDAEEFARAGYHLLKGDEGPGSRERKGKYLAELLSWRARPADLESGVEEAPEREPMIVFMDTPRNRVLFEQLKRMVPDPDDPDAPLKVDFNEEREEPDGHNYSGDDGQDATWMATDGERAVPFKVPAPKEAPKRHFDNDFEKLMKGINDRQAHGYFGRR